jgi:pyrroloquinoline quinone biosynthesis protein B
VLGAAAGGGFPQWNCACSNCRRARAGDAAARPRTQCSVAVSADGERWCLLNASPDLRAQIDATPALQPQQAPRHSPIEAVVLTNGDIDAIAGLLHLRERQPLAIYATHPVLAALEANPVFDVLARNVVRRVPLELERPVELGRGLAVEAFAVPGKVALYLEEGVPEIGAETGDTVGLRVASAGRAFFFVPSCAGLTPALAARLAGAELVLFDGTVYHDDEMIRIGAGNKAGRRMGHMSVAGPEGSLAAFADLAVARKIYVHVNNTNPILLDDAPERAVVTAAGWEVAHDGLEIALP